MRAAQLLCAHGWLLGALAKFKPTCARSATAAAAACIASRGPLTWEVQPTSAVTASQVVVDEQLLKQVALRSVQPLAVWPVVAVNPLRSRKGVRRSGVGRQARGRCSMGWQDPSAQACCPATHTSWRGCLVQCKLAARSAMSWLALALRLRGVTRAACCALGGRGGGSSTSTRKALSARKSGRLRSFSTSAASPQ